MITPIANALCGDYSWSEFGPELFLVGLAAVLLAFDCFWKTLPKRVLGMIGALGAFGAAWALAYPLPSAGSVFSCLAALSTGLMLLLAFDYAKVTEAASGEGRYAEGSGEFYVLPLIACAGVSVMAKAQDLVLLFVGLEVLSLSSYAMAGFYRKVPGSVEAGVKYLVMGALSTGFLVLGIAWYFGMTGSFLLEPATLARSLSEQGQLIKGVLLALALLLAAVSFKVGAFPMHVWIPDVYQGAPVPVTSFLSVVSKIAGFAALTSIFGAFRVIFAPGMEDVLLTFGCVAAATLLVGNLGAIPQNDMKRLLGYSSIAQAGFILVLYLFPGSFEGYIGPLVFYLAAYMLATMGAFFALGRVRLARGSNAISAFRGLAVTNPLSAFCVAVFFASLAGVPLTAGFLAKLFSFVAAFQTLTYLPSLAYWLLPVMIVCAAAGFYYYFKVIRAMYWLSPDEDDEPVRVPFATGLVMGICAALIILFGTVWFFVWPGSCA